MGSSPCAHASPTLAARNRNETRSVFRLDDMGPFLLGYVFDYLLLARRTFVTTPSFKN